MSVAKEHCVVKLQVGLQRRGEIRAIRIMGACGGVIILCAAEVVISWY